jgi:septal ring factor EnvC (AmiA/AmiB activator)
MLPKGFNQMIVVLFLCIFLMPFFSEAQQKDASPKNKTMTTGRQDASRQPAYHQLSEAERLELEQDLEKMRTLIDQMQHNLAAAATGETPLKRQFQLDIEMWQLLVQRMERQLEGPAKK